MNAAALVARARALMEAGRPGEAAELYRRLAALLPGRAAVLNNLGNALDRAGDAAGAEAAYREAVTIDPGLAEAHDNLGTLLAAQGRPGEAEACFRRAVAARPGFATAGRNLGAALLEKGEPEAAIDALRAALALEPDSGAAWFNLGHALVAAGRFDEAADAYRRALDAAPDDAAALAHLVHLLQRRCAWAEAATLAPRLEALDRAALAAGRVPGETPFMSIARIADPALNRRVAEAWSADIVRRLAPVARMAPFVHAGRRDGRVRIGYLSGNFRDHPTAHNVAGVLSRHDRARFEVTAYAVGAGDSGSARARVREASERFVDLGFADARAAAGRIHADGVDILVALTGHTSGSRLDVCALRPAPVQVAWLTFPGTSGAPFLDYIVADRVVVPPGEDAHFSEAVVRLPHSYWPTDDRPEAAAAPGRTEEGLPADEVVFCSFNQAYKIEPVMFGAWMRVLVAVPGSVLWLLGGDAAVEDALRRAAVADGVDGGRLVFAARRDKARHIARIGLADLVLDTRVYGGHTTTVDALRAGVPVLTVAGRHFASRVSASMLAAMGLRELILPDLDSFEAAAIALGRDADRRAALRARVAAGRATAPLFDTARFTRNLERAFAAMWERHAGGLAPAAIAIDEEVT